jgi:hypothetical protein
MLLVDSRGKTRVLGWVAVSIVVCFEVYKYSLAYLGDAPAESLKTLFLLLFIRILFESRKRISLEAMGDDGIGAHVL